MSNKNQRQEHTSSYYAATRIADDMPQLSELEGMPEYEAIQSRMIEHLNSERGKLGLEPVST